MFILVFGEVFWLASRFHHVHTTWDRCSTIMFYNSYRSLKIAFRRIDNQKKAKGETTTRKFRKEIKTHKADEIFSNYSNGLLLNFATKNMHEDDNDSYANGKNNFLRLFFTCA
jgi:hypothetical protein